MERTYTRRSRSRANVAINILILLALGLAKGESRLFVILEALFLVPCIIYYAYYIASLCCAECGQSYVRLPKNVPAQEIVVLFSSLHTPDQCPHCGAKSL